MRPIANLTARSTTACVWHLSLGLWTCACHVRHVVSGCAQRNTKLEGAVVHMSHLPHAGSLHERLRSGLFETLRCTYRLLPYSLRPTDRISHGDFLISRFYVTTSAVRSTQHHYSLHPVHGEAEGREETGNCACGRVAPTFEVCELRSTLNLGEGVKSEDSKNQNESQNRGHQLIRTPQVRSRDNVQRNTKGLLLLAHL